MIINIYNQFKSYSDEEKANIVDKIMADFDFEKVHICMERVGWTWGGFNPKVPTTIEMKEVTAELLNNVISDPEMRYTSTGGFRAEKDECGIRLAFILECRNLDRDHDDTY